MVSDKCRCGPCKMIAPKLEQWSTEYPAADFLKIDVDQLAELAQELGITAMPTFFFYRDGKKVKELVGANPTALKGYLDQYAK